MILGQGRFVLTSPDRTFDVYRSCIVRLIQYVVLGPRLKVINLNILPESSRNELKYSLKIAFMFLSIILKFQVPDINILFGIRKKATVFDGPWPANGMVLGPRVREAA